jgi:hypothetical protein
MSEDNNGNRNSIKPVAKKVKMDNSKSLNLAQGKTKIKGTKENTITEVTKRDINVFGINNKNVIKRKK